MKRVLVLVVLLGFIQLPAFYAVGGETITFDSKLMEITDVAVAIEKKFGRRFVIDPSVRGKITIVSSKALAEQEAYEVLLTGLALNGFTVVDDGKFQRITNSRLASKSNVPTITAAPTGSEERIQTMILALPKTLSVNDFNKNMRGITSKDGDLHVYESTNSLIVTDYTSTLKKIAILVENLATTAEKKK